MEPFLSWVGGKRRLLPEIEPYFTQCGCKKFVDLFCGAGSVSMKSGDYFDDLLLNDLNLRLINTFYQIKTAPVEIISVLEQLAYFYERDDQSYVYDRVRTLLNTTPPSTVHNAAAFIFLNKTCFNGLYRENGKGEFNVAFGKRTSPTIFDRDNIMNWHNFLQNVSLSNLDFENVSLDSDCFVYLDPPYVPNRSGEVKYNCNSFLWSGHIRLRNFLYNLDDRGIKFLYSNSRFAEHKLWFSRFNVQYVSINRLIAADSYHRSVDDEILVSNF